MQKGHNTDVPSGVIRIKNAGKLCEHKNVAQSNLEGKEERT